MFSFNLTIVVFAFFQISATMQKFEGMFEDLDVNTQVECAVNSIIFYLLFIYLFIYLLFCHTQ